jgi:hypothetical protein
MTHNRIVGSNSAHGAGFRLGLLSILLLSICLSATLSWAQGAVGTIVGRVSDSSGALIPGAAVVVTNVATNVAVKTKTTSSGDFTVPYLNPAVYRVTVEAHGFKKADEENITLAVDQTMRADVVLHPGEVSETVTVNSTGVALDTETSAVGEVITEKQILDLPMQDRSFNSLLLLAPGVTTTVTNGGLAVDLPGEVSDVSGTRAASSLYLIDGMTNSDPYFTPPVVRLSLDAIQEFKEQTSGYSAQFGGAAGQINMLTKSGTNSLHGTVFEFIRNDAFDAILPFTPAGVKKSPLRQNDYGYSVGGPVYIPKVYNGRNHTFFFANFERLKSTSSGVGYGEAPTVDQLNGLIPDHDPLTKEHNAVTILDPLTGQPFPKDSNGNYVIPQSRWSRLAQVANPGPGKYFPIAGVQDAFIPSANTFKVVSNPYFYNQQTYKVDHNFGSKDRLSERFTLVNNVALNQSIHLYANQPLAISSQSFNVIETHTFNDHLINEARVGWFDYHNLREGDPPPDADIAALGLKNTYPAAGENFPQIGINFNGGGGGAFGLPTGNSSAVWNGEDSLSWVKGKHFLTLGALVYVNDGDTGPIGNVLGSYSFDGSVTSPAGVTPTGGNAWADYLLGDIVNGQASIPTGWGLAHPSNPPWFLNQKKFAAYVQDDWKIASRLTLNVGLRYDFQTNPDNQQALWPSLSVDGGVLCTNDKKWVDSGNGGTLYKSCTRDTPNKPFAPRVGFSFRPTASDKNVIRGGYGIFYDQYELYEWASQVNYPWSETANPGHQNFNDLFAAPTAKVTPDNVAGLYNVQPAEMKLPYIQEFTLSVERELPFATKLNVAYVGTLGTHLNTRVAANQPNGYDANDTPEQRAARYPFRNFGTYGLNGTPWGPGFVLQNVYGFSSNYNALEVSVNHRTKDVALLASYTWSSTMDSASSSGCAGLDCNEAGWGGPMDAHNFKADYSKSSYDVPQRIVVSMVYDLPFGRGKRFGASMNKAADAVIGGWQVNGIYQAQTGIPFSNLASDIGGVLEANAERPNRIGNPKPGFKKSVAEWFDTSMYSQPAQGVFGTEHRNDLRAPGLNYMDLSLFKNISLTEHAKFQFRVEAFNALNQLQLGAPDPYIGNGFGSISGYNVPSRIVQLGGKIIF